MLRKRRPTGENASLPCSRVAAIQAVPPTLTTRHELFQLDLSVIGPEHLKPIKPDPKVEMPVISFLEERNGVCVTTLAQTFVQTQTTGPTLKALRDVDELPAVNRQTSERLNGGEQFRKRERYRRRRVVIPP